MKKIIIIFVIGLLTRQFVLAQGEITYLSNLGQPSTGSNPVGSDSWIASEVITGNNSGGYLLDSIQLEMADASGNPSGFTIMIYNSAADFDFHPGNSLGTLNGSLNPASAGTYTYIAPSDFLLSPSTDYFIVLTSATPVTQFEHPINGAYEWNFIGANLYNPSGGWRAGGVWKSSDGLSWAINSGAPQFAINATPIPEPSSLALVLLGSGVLFYVRRQVNSTRQP